jgi:hypothetical protein
MTGQPIKHGDIETRFPTATDTTVCPTLILSRKAYPNVAYGSVFRVKEIYATRVASSRNISLVCDL